MAAFIVCSICNKEVDNYNYKELTQPFTTFTLSCHGTTWQQLVPMNYESMLLLMLHEQ